MFWKKKQKEQLENANKPISGYQYHTIAITDAGCLRSENEDSILFIRSSEKQIRDRMGCLAIVADGMGGHASGEVASSMAIDTISEIYFQTNTSPEKALLQAGRQANKRVWKAAQTREELKGMGTTCTAAALIGDKIFILHIGDSRAYLFKHGTLIQLSDDHTYVQELVRSGSIQPSEAQNHPDSNILTKSLGTVKKRDCDVFLSEYSFEPGDKLLLCSDGLYENFSTEELETFLNHSDLNHISQRLKQATLNRGAQDNFSLILIEPKQEVAVESAPTRVIMETS